MRECRLEIEKPKQEREEPFLAYCLRLAEWEKAVKANNRAIGAKIDTAGKAPRIRNDREETKELIRSRRSIHDRIADAPANSVFMREIADALQKQRWGE